MSSAIVTVIIILMPVFFGPWRRAKARAHDENLSTPTRCASVTRAAPCARTRSLPTPMRCSVARACVVPANLRTCTEKVIDTELASPHVRVNAYTLLSFFTLCPLTLTFVFSLLAQGIYDMICDMIVKTRDQTETRSSLLLNANFLSEDFFS